MRSPGSHARPGVHSATIKGHVQTRSQNKRSAHLTAHHLLLLGLAIVCTRVTGQDVATPLPTPVPIPMATPLPTPIATAPPTEPPTAQPTLIPTAMPSPQPTEATLAPTAATPPPTPFPVEVTAAPTEVPIPEATPAPVPDVTPAPIPDATPAPIPDATPAPIPDATLAPVPDATPAPVPAATEAPVPGATAAPTDAGAAPVVSPAPTARPTTPAPTPKPVVPGQPTNSPTAAPTMEPAAGVVGGTITVPEDTASSPAFAESLRLGLATMLEQQAGAVVVGSSRRRLAGVLGALPEQGMRGIAGGRRLDTTDTTWLVNFYGTTAPTDASTALDRLSSPGNVSVLADYLAVPANQIVLSNVQYGQGPKTVVTNFTPLDSNETSLSLNAGTGAVTLGHSSIKGISYLFFCIAFIILLVAACGLLAPWLCLWLVLGRQDSKGANEALFKGDRRDSADSFGLDRSEGDRPYPMAPAVPVKSPIHHHHDSNNSTRSEAELYGHNLGEYDTNGSQAAPFSTGGYESNNGNSGPGHYHVSSSTSEAVTPGSTVGMMQPMRLVPQPPHGTAPSLGGSAESSLVGGNFGTRVDSTLLTASTQDHYGVPPPAIGVPPDQSDTESMRSVPHSRSPSFPSVGGTRAARVGPRFPDMPNLLVSQAGNPISPGGQSMAGSEYSVASRGTAVSSVAGSRRGLGPQTPTSIMSLGRSNLGSPGTDAGVARLRTLSPGGSSVIHQSQKSHMSTHSMGSSGGPYSPTFSDDTDSPGMTAMWHRTWLQQRADAQRFEGGRDHDRQFDSQASSVAASTSGRVVPRIGTDTLPLGRQ